MFAKILVSSFMIFIFCACSFKPQALEAPSSHLLFNQSKESSPKIHHFNTLILKIKSPQSPLYIKSNKIAYIKDKEFAFYTKHLFENPPAKAFVTILSRKLEQNALFKAVIDENSLLKPDLILETRIDSFVQIYHQEKAFATESFVDFALNALLINDKGLIERAYFHTPVSVRTDEVFDVFNKAMNALSEDIITWLLSIEKDNF